MCMHNSEKIQILPVFLVLRLLQNLVAQLHRIKHLPVSLLAHPCPARTSLYPTLSLSLVSLKMNRRCS